MATKKLAIWVVVDEDGNYEVAGDVGDATERFAENVRALNDCFGIRTLKVVIDVPLPVLIELSGEVPAEGAATLSVGG